MKKKIIVMMSTYNGEKYVDRQLYSIYKQKTECEITLYVRDDGSTDDTLEIIHSWGKKININYIKDDENLGAARSFWKILKNVPVADYYAFVDQDDMWDEDKIQAATDTIGDSKGPVLWCSNYRTINSNDEIINEKKYKEKPPLNIISQMICGNIQGCSMVFNRAAYDRVKDVNDKDLLMHDIVVMQYVLADGEVIYEDKPFFSYRIHENNVVAKQGKSKIKAMKSSLNRWFGKEHKCEVSKLAEKILVDNSKNLDEETKEYLINLTKCKKSIKSRIWIIKNKKTYTNNKKAGKSFKMRVALGIV